MDIHTTVSAMKKLGCEVSVVKTGHTDYIRGFVKHNGVTHGRITFFKGNYSHVKWYLGDYGAICESDQIYYSWSYLLRTGRVLTSEKWSEILALAESLSEEDFVQKTEWRNSHPTPERTDGKRRRRKPLQRETTRKFLRNLIQTID
ncbi:TPA: hypothetical protein ACKE08_003480 [Citrobacter koseri]